MEIKNMFKPNKLIVYIYLNSFYLFISIIYGLKNLKLYKNLRNFDYILFSLYFLW